MKKQRTWFDQTGENLGRISRGEWWIYSDPDDMRTYRKKVRKPGNWKLCSYDDHKYFSWILHCLSYDIIGFAEYFKDEFISDWIKDSHAGECGEAMGATMPVKRFLERYQEFDSEDVTTRRGDKSEIQKKRSRTKNNVKMQAFQALREHFHK